MTSSARLFKTNFDVFGNVVKHYNIISLIHVSSQSKLKSKLKIELK